MTLEDRLMFIFITSKCIQLEFCVCTRQFTICAWGRKSINHATGECASYVPILFFFPFYYLVHRVKWILRLHRRNGNIYKESSQVIVIMGM